jgi:DNA-binding response OmpR family regulator
VLPERGSGRTSRPFPHPGEVATAARHTPSPYGPPTVLVVEDDELARDAIRWTLAYAGYRVLTAPTGRDAVAACWDMTEPVDMVLLDVHLPDVSGVDLCARPRELSPDLPAVVCSSEAGPQEVARLMGLGVRRYYQKPLDPDELLATVEAALRGGGGTTDGP